MAPACVVRAVRGAPRDARPGPNAHVDPMRIHTHLQCWMQQSPPRDPVTHELVPNATRFPSGMKALGDYVRDKSVS